MLVRSVAALALTALAGAGCGGPERARTRRLPSSVFQAARIEAKGAPGDLPRGDEGAAFVARALRGAGLRFGTDGSTRALWGYARTSHRVVRPTEARPGDLLFFETGPSPIPADCGRGADHAGIVEGVGPDGRIAFVEMRAGRVRHSFVDPAHPAARRGPRGEILNSFLRPKAITDPPEARYFAGEMLCAVVRVTPR